MGKTIHEDKKHMDFFGFWGKIFDLHGEKQISLAEWMAPKK